jgi:glycosyltransferase involved in cell wall biosynthesis
MAHTALTKLNTLRKDSIDENSTMKVAYFAYIDRKVGPYFHAVGFSSAFSKFVDRLCIIGIKDTDKMPNYNRPKALRLLKKLQPHITWDIKLILKNALRIPREYAILKREKPDIIILRYELYTYSAAVLAWLFKIPLIIEANGSPAFECDKFGTPGNYHLARFFEKRILAASAAINAISKEVKDFIVQTSNITEGKIHINPNGVDLEKFKPRSTAMAKRQLGLGGRFVVGFIGSFSPWHDLMTLVKAAKIVVAYKPNVCFLLVGDGRLRSYIQRRVSECNLNDFVKFTGRVRQDRITSYIAAMDVAIALSLPTYGDKFHGSPVKIFEYMAMKKAIIATRIGQFEEIIADGSNGIIVKQQDEKAVAREIITLTEDEQLRTKLGVNAYNTIIEKGYTWEENAKRAWQVCKAVLQR